ncbi:MAG: hypothetical protein ACYDA5_10945 [Vulcanimicrobiaceae bacterium]
MELDSDDPAAEDRSETVNQPRFRTLLPQALREFAKRGYTSEADLQERVLRLQEWQQRLRAMLEGELPTDEQIHKELAAVVEPFYQCDEADRSGVQPRVTFGARYTIDRVAPDLRTELDSRIVAIVDAGVDRIKVDKRAATEQTLQRFAAWAWSVPRGGAAKIKTREIAKIAKKIAKPLAQFEYERRRVAIDQGHKLLAAIAHVAAEAEGAIAAIWHDRGEDDKSYDARPEHLARAGKIFLIRDSWAMQEGLVKKAGHQYTDEIEQPGFWPMCSCAYEYIVSPRNLPEPLLTAKGREWVRTGAVTAGAPPQTDPFGSRRSQTRKVPRPIPRLSKPSRSRHSWRARLRAAFARFFGFAPRTVCLMLSRSRARHST